MKYLVWSNEKRMWHRAHQSGYTAWIEEAGRYELAEARAIVADATVDGRLLHHRVDPITAEPYDGLDEYLVLAPEHAEDAEPVDWAEVARDMVSDDPERIRRHLPPWARATADAAGQPRMSPDVPGWPDPDARPTY